MLPPSPSDQPDAEPAIVPDQISAVGTIHLAWQLDALHAFDVADRLVELATRGKLKLGAAPVSTTLTDYAFDPDRLSDAERLHLYARTFGARTSAALEGEINLEFDTLWLRFVAAVAESAPEPDPATAPRPPLLARWTVRRAARELALNLSRHGAERARDEARTLHRSIERLLHLLQAPEVLKALGAPSMWEAIERVNREHLGSTVDTARGRALAQSGSHIIGWLAAHAADLSGHAASAPSAQADADLIATVERWLAASGTPAAVLAATERTAEAVPARLDRVPTLSAEVMNALNRIEADARSRPGGVCALFVGRMDAARMLAAQVLASRLAHDLYRVDLAAVAARSIGETDTNLERVLAQARESAAVLLFDAADALFGARTQVQGAHDLLRRIEAHTGLVILVGTVPDDSLRRRLHFVVDFPP